MIRFERTRDYAAIARVLTHPRVYPALADDCYPAPENFGPLESEAIVYLLAYDDEQLLGLFSAHAINGILWEAHVALLPNAARRRGRAAGAAFFAWLWEHTAAEVVAGFIPSDNTLALRYAARLGMRASGRLPAAFARGGRRHDLIVLSQARPQPQQ